MVHSDCIYFPGDRPCRYHKETGITCEQCNRYRRVGTTILIVKLDALGDVLRTTCLLPSLRKAYPECKITWLTSPHATDLFIGNKLVDEVMELSIQSYFEIHSREFDILINPDASSLASSIATVVRAKKKYGFIRSTKGFIVPQNEAANTWFMMGGSDLLKRGNRKTYQEILHEICELDPSGQEIVLRLTPSEKEAEKKIGDSIGLEEGRPTVGINTGAGERWQLKRWNEEKFIQVIDFLVSSTEAQVVLLGGKQEWQTNVHIRSNFPTRVLLPQPGSLRRLIQLVDLCDVVLTGDTLALHIACGLKKRVVALFGPTSSAEIDLYGRGTKIVPNIECICCYKERCDRHPNCMDLISVETVFNAVTEQLLCAAPVHAVAKSKK